MAKLIIAIIVLGLGTAMMILPGIGILSVIEDNIQVKYEGYHIPDWAVFLAVGLIAFVLSLIGKPLHKTGTGRVLYIILTGILPGFVVCMGWQAIDEAKKEIGTNNDDQHADANQRQ